MEINSMHTPRSIAIREPRRGGDFSQELAEKGWYHSFALPDGTRIEGYGVANNHSLWSRLG
jgi:hypothetical protein